MPFLALGTASPLGDLIALVTGSSLLGRLVLLLLFLMSVFSWALMAERGRRLRQAAKANAGFWTQFRAGHEDPDSLHRLAIWSEQNPQSPLAGVFTYFSREFWPSYGRQGGGGGSRLAALNGVLARGIDRVATAEMTGLERGVSWLATFTSTAPFIGLLGTVYGILGSFLEIGRQGSASLDAVGPGIAESLVATVAGLAVAIPAAVAYNYFVGKLRHQDAELQALGAQLGDLLAREELGRGRRPGRALVTGAELGGLPGGGRGKRSYGNLAEINVTPLVDVMLVLLIIFMLTAPFIVGGVDVNLPHTRTTAKTSVEGFIVTVDKQRRVYVDEDQVPLAQLGEILREIRPADDLRPVYLRSDQEVAYGFVVRVMGVLKDAGIEGLSLVVDPTEEN